jgi:hypothetical protein
MLPISLMRTRLAHARGPSRPLRRDAQPWRRHRGIHHGSYFAPVQLAALGERIGKRFDQRPEQRDAALRAEVKIVQVQLGHLVVAIELLQDVDRVTKVDFGIAGACGADTRASPR